MKCLAIFFIAVLVSVLMPISGFSQAGALDDSYANNGIAIFSPGASHDIANDVVILADTSAIICGSSIFNTSFDGFLMRILPDGTQDMGFGTGGIVQINFGAETYAYALAAQPDGKIVVAGLTYTVIPDAEFFIARFNPDGTPDLTFNSTGHYICTYSSSEEILNDMTMQPDGKFVLAGSTNSGGSQLLFTRINSNGTLDNSFGTNGYTVINGTPESEAINAVKIMGNGNIIGAGYGVQQAPLWGEQLFMVKLNPSGVPDPGFGTNGVLIPAVFNDVSSANDLIIDNDSIYMTGYMYDAGNNLQLFIAKLNPSGNAYSDFGTNGISFLFLNPLNAGYEIMRTGDNKLYVCGTSGQGGTGDRDFLLARYLPSGMLDADFDSDGYVMTPVQPAWDEANAMGMQPDGKIVLAGMSSGFPTNPNDICMTRYLNDYLPSGLYANFSVNPAVACEGVNVQYTDMSFSTDSTVLTWSWTFEGGTPPASATQNPVVSYANAGIYDVGLIVFDGIYYDTLMQEDFITVEAIPAQSATPSGPSVLCGTYSGNYTTTDVDYADGYDWMVTPSNAGTITSNGPTATFLASATWTGSCSIQVRGTGLCGDGPWSTGYPVEIYMNPFLFQLTGDGAFCEGDPGAEIMLDGSEPDVDYELYLSGEPTGIIVEGTGSAISFGFINTIGLYTVEGYTDHCTETMVGQVYVHMMPLPSQAATPTGPEMACEGQTTTYISSEIDEADLYVWTLSPEEAGALTPVFDTVHIAWTPGWTGTAQLSIYGENLCGEGPESAPLEIAVGLTPDPVISGLQLVCDNTQEIYETANNPGSFYTWEVTGGVVTSGAGTYQATVLWGDPGAGTLSVTEETEQGCTETAETFDVIIEECISVGEMDTDPIRIYPNPAKDVLYIITSRELHMTELRIISTYGQVMDKIKINASSNHSRLDVSKLTPGVYMLEFRDATKFIYSTLVVITK